MLKQIHPYNGAPFPALVGVTGRMRSGKNALATYLEEKYGYHQVAFAEALKEYAADVLNCLPNFAGDARRELGWTGKDWNGDKSYLGRKLLQTMGHGGRVRLNRDVWVEALGSTIANKGLMLGIDRIVVTDLRYGNEVDWVSSRGGLVIRIVRPDIDRSGPEHQHETETAIDTLPVHYEIVNDAQLGDLYFWGWLALGADAVPCGA